MIGRLIRSARARFGSFRDARRLRAMVRRAEPVRIVIGASGIYDAGWIPTEIGVLDILNRGHWSRVFAENSIDALLAEHVWEHLTPEQGLLAARNCLRYLKPGGYLRVAVPDGFHSDPKYIDCVRVGGSGAGADDHKVLYNCDSFGGLFEQAGFEVALLEYFDSAGAFHAVEWDPAGGMIHRSKRFDERNRDGRLNYTSLILDARKPDDSKSIRGASRGK
jgi:predicted SAM-dependent methyltransferase